MPIEVSMILTKIEVGVGSHTSCLEGNAALKVNLQKHKLLSVYHNV